MSYLYRITYILLLATSLWSHTLCALETGEMRIFSALNQLFDAKILLPGLKPADISKLSVRLAAPKDFKAFKLERAPILANFVFSLEYNAEGQVYVRVVSTQPVREPSLTFLIEFAWAKGKAVREFVVFLDPVQRMAKTPVAPTPTPVPVPTLPPPPPKVYVPGDIYGPVAARETLGSIAQKIHIKGITQAQLMQALISANPRAFVRPDPSGLKAKVKLRIPSLQEIADSTGSPEAQQAATQAKTDRTKDIAGTTPKMAPDIAEVFVLPEPESLEPVRTTPNTARLPVEKPITPEETPIAHAQTPAPSTEQATASTTNNALLEDVAEALADTVVAHTWYQDPLSALTMTALEVHATPVPARPTQPVTPPPAAPQATPPTVDGATFLQALQDTASHWSKAPPIPPPSVPARTLTHAPKPADITPTVQHYGPTAIHETVWDIALRTRPDPQISKDHMAKALFAVNPYAFSKPGKMDSLRIGVVLRIPTLREIADITGAPAAVERIQRPSPTVASEQHSVQPSQKAH